MDGRNADHPDQTFDYAAQRPDGRKLAIEISGALDEDWLKGEPAWRELAVTVEAAVQSAYPSVTGLYVIAPTRGDTRRAKDRDVDALARTVAEHFDAGAATEAAVDDVWLRYFHGQPELVVESAYGMSGFEDGSESEARFRKALASNIGKMRKAGEAGYETHLAVIHGTIGTTHGWR